MAGVRLPSGSFQDQSVAFQGWKYTRPIKDSNGKGQFKEMLVFLFVDKRKIFVTKLSLEEFNTLFFTSELLACFGSTKAAKFWKKSQVHSVLYGQGKYVFKREFLYL